MAWRGVAWRGVAWRGAWSSPPSPLPPKVITTTFSSYDGSCTGPSSSFEQPTGCQSYNGVSFSYSCDPYTSLDEAITATDPDVTFTTYTTDDCSGKVGSGVATVMGEVS